MPLAPLADPWSKKVELKEELEVYPPVEASRLIIPLLASGVHWSVSEHRLILFDAFYKHIQIQTYLCSTFAVIDTRDY